MPPPAKLLGTVPDGAARDEFHTLHAGVRTRVLRLQAAGIVLKEYLGPGAGARMSREKDILQQLSGAEGVVQLAAAPAGAHALAMRDCGGVALSQLLGGERCDLGHALRLATQLTRSLVQVHRAGIVHRDVNPSNVVISSAGEPVLIDFDHAALAAGPDTGSAEPDLVGTLAYLAPEQSGRTGRPTDHRADLYALGAMLYRMVTGQLPFASDDPLVLVHDHLVRVPVAPVQLDGAIPATLSDIILRLLAKSPDERYQSAEGLLHDLQRLVIDLQDGGDSRFALGERDFPARLSAPARILGRSAESGSLRQVFEAARHTPWRTVLVSGAAGIGKSALLAELRPVVAAAGGWFVDGKFDQCQKDTSLAGGMTQAGRALGRLLLTLPRSELADMQRRMLDSLGRRAGVITRLLPEFALLLGEQPEAPEIDFPRQGESLMLQAIGDLVRAIASPQRPLVIALDDLHWAGALSLRVFEQLMTDASTRGLMLIGAYRPEEVGEGHLLAPVLARWRQHPQAPAEVRLEGLSPASAGVLLGEMLRLDAASAHELACMLDKFTGGNPFDTLEMVNALRAQGVLTLEERGWQWEKAGIGRFVGGSNVVNLLAARLARLPTSTQALLEYLSCLGGAVAPELLASAVGADLSELRALLTPAVHDSLLVIETNSGRELVWFRHDRIQQAVLESMDAALRSARQLDMARRMARETRLQHRAAQQYLSCAECLTDPSERRLAAQLFHATAQELARTARHDLAERYLHGAHVQLQALGDPADATLRIRIIAARHACLYSLGRLDESDALFPVIESAASGAEDLVEPTCLQMRALDMRGHTDQSVDIGLRLLRRLGLELPVRADNEHALDKLGAWLEQDARLNPSTRPQIGEPRLLAIAKLLGRTVRSAMVRYDTCVIVSLLLEGQRLWATHGTCPALVACLGRLSPMLIALRQDYRTASALARHVLDVGEALGYEPQASEARFIYSAYACHWAEPMEESLRQSRQAYEGVLAGGDLGYAGYTHIMQLAALLELAATIDRVAAEVDAGLDLCERTGNYHAAVPHACLRHMLRALQDTSKGDDARQDEAAHLAIAKLPYFEFNDAIARALTALVMGDAGVLVRNAERAVASMGNMSGFFTTFYAHLCMAMARAWQLQGGHEGDTAPMLAELASSRDWLAARAEDQPRNFLHMLRLVQAEEAWAMGDFWKAAGHFDAAMREVQLRERPWHRALIAERAGLFHLSTGLVHAGAGLLTQARDAYAAWGASAKVEQMRRKHPELRKSASAHVTQAAPDTAGGTASSSGVSADALDLLGVLRASQVLSSETSLARLTTRVCEVLEALSGATRVLVLSCSEDEWWLLTPTPGESAIPLFEAAQRRLLPLTVFEYARRTAQALVVDDAISDDRFARDPYFSRLPCCSVLAAPIAGPGGTQAMLLLENRHGRAAFNAQRLDAVMLIAGQLAVSLANVQIYESLEQRVQARTRELQQTQAELVATARRAGKAEIANNVLHNIGNVLNSVNVSTGMMRRTLDQSRLEGLGRAVDLINAHAHDLRGLLADAPRANALVAYLNEVLSRLRAERESTLADLQRVSQSVEHITYVMTSQRSHSGPSSIVESVRPQEVLEEALRLSAGALEDRAVTVLRQFADVPPVVLDRQVVVQILVNLLRNAAQAMQGLPAQSRELTLSMALLHDDERVRLRIGVRDRGEGIRPENLTRIFAHGFTTRADGHGFGLHSAALAALEAGGTLTAHSDGPGLGALFVLDMPVTLGEPPGASELPA